jgi:hypothetical protein
MARWAMRPDQPLAPQLHRSHHGVHNIMTSFHIRAANYEQSCRIEDPESRIYDREAPESD